MKKAIILGVLLLTSHACTSYASDVPDQLRLSVESDSLDYNQETPIALRIKLVNDGDHTVSYHDLVSDQWFYSFTVLLIKRDGKREAVRRTAFANMLDQRLDTGGGWSGEPRNVKPGESVVINWPLSKFYDFTQPGKYEIVVSVITPESERAKTPKEVKRISSEPLFLQVHMVELPHSKKQQE